MKRFSAFLGGFFGMDVRGFAEHLAPSRKRMTDTSSTTNRHAANPIGNRMFPIC